VEQLKRKTADEGQNATDQTADEGQNAADLQLIERIQQFTR
jgi:hypothetical protein